LIEDSLIYSKIADEMHHRLLQTSDKDSILAALNH
jgi:hypothetical protein